MYKIPNDNKKFSQTNQSDLSGNISITKNINFDEEGYLKLSSRTISLLNDVTDSDLGLPVSFGRYASGSFYISTTNNPYLFTFNETTLDIQKDTDSDGGSPPSSVSTSSTGLWWRNLWHITDSTKLYTKSPSTGNWTDTGVSLTTGVTHSLCDFAKSGTLLVGNGNVVKQLNSSYAVGSYDQLTLSTDYEVIGMAYYNNQVAIATRLSSSVAGQNKEAGLFIWDGSESSANSMYNVGSDACIGIAPYKSSFVILTRDGELKYFNGGGFEKLASFPVYFKDYVWGNFLSRQSRGDTIIAKGDILYININSEVNNETTNNFEESMIGGIWCYDPNVGLYHKYSPSISTATLITSTEANTNLTDNSFTTSDTIPETGNPIIASQSGVSPIRINQNYYIIKSSPTLFKLAETYEDAIAFNAIDLTSKDGATYFISLNLKDYGQSKTKISGGIALYGDIKNIYSDILFGTELYNTSNTTDWHINSVAPNIKNIGYFITPKLTSQNIEDNIQKLYIKYRPLKDDDKITIKYKNKDFNGIPEYASCTATSSTVFTTTSNISNSYTSTEELELEILSGAGAGQMTKISSINQAENTTQEKLVTSYSETNQNGLTTLAGISYGGDNEYFGQTFHNTDTCVLKNLVFLLKKTGTPTGNITATIYSMSGTLGVNGNKTGSVLATSDAVDISTLTTSFALTTFTFSGANKITLEANTDYAIQINYNSDVGLIVGFNYLTSTYEGNAYSEEGSYATSDLCFYVYAEITPKITLSEELEGISANDVMYVKIDNWKVLDTITSADSENWKEIPLAKNSKWTKFKVVLEGSDLAIEELQINNEKFK